MQQLSISKHLNYRRASASLSNYRRARSSIPGASFRCSSLGPSVRPTVRPAAALLTALLVLPADRRESPTSRIAIASPSLRSGRTLNSVILALRLSPNRGSQVAYEQNLFCTAVRPPPHSWRSRAAIRESALRSDPIRSVAIRSDPNRSDGSHPTGLQFAVIALLRLRATRRLGPAADRVAIATN